MPKLRDQESTFQIKKILRKDNKIFTWPLKYRNNNKEFEKKYIVCRNSQEK